MSEPDGHDVIEVDTAVSEECGLGSAARIDLDLMTTHKQVEGGEEPRASKRRLDLVDSRQGE